MCTHCLFSLRIYTALKLVGLLFDEDASLFSLRIYTALKQKFIVSHKLTPFVFPTNLHCSQTMLLFNVSNHVFVFPTNLHCSQTTNKRNNLKSEFVFPTNLHCSQTMLLFNVSNHVFVFPTNLHCSQTVRAFYERMIKFVFPTNLHCSQTSNRPRIIFCKIPVSLHRSYHSSLY